MQNGPDVIQQQQWRPIQEPEESILINISQTTLSPTIRLWHARYETTFFPTQNALIRKALHDAKLGTATKKRQAEFWAGRSLMMLAFCQNIPLGKSASGAPAFPKGRNGALSHSRENVLLLEGPDDLLFGVDMEPPLVPVSLQAVLSKVATEAEQKWLRCLPPEQQVYAATILFSAKETLFKLLNREMDICPCYATVEAREAPNSGSVVFELTRRSGYGLPAGERFIIMYDRIRENTVTWGIHSPKCTSFSNR
ncbi:4'-phosphopantetheinyl transferase superfamily protein [Yersinia sp. KBS0713]|uniref:4'-phosphopantetheinyl transferase family protein n=1 Tax=Yersinia TaxID=629 RepID=UPI00110EBBB5|nr:MULTISPECIES: 4'-phosphopantetheinyl transferase superfamily protein [Yersinia]QDW31687.1 4'-phosphopantetheinyl transferase superfamily protein [Yersinia sp. KBS0713]QDW33433.1 4'-phosphopantetheinyl transferase superfamily protein [Yersinia sp. KBS0713]